MGIGISPLVDYAFKRILGSPEHSGITMHFLNAILVGQPKITRVTFLNPILNKDSDDDKLAVLDILATDEHGRRLNIEMQTSLPTGMAQRLAYYAASSYASQLSEGQSYSKLCPSISICVLLKSLFAVPNALHLDFRLREALLNLTLTDDLQIHLLQLNHLQVTADTVYNATPAEQWTWFLREVHELTQEDVVRLFPDKVFHEAFGVLQMISQTAEEMIAYQARLKHQRDEEGRMTQARLDGEARGIEIGEARGEARGIEIGEVRGELRGQICLLQKFLGQQVWTTEEFSACDLTQLKSMAEQLEQQLKARNPKN
ncbi:MAG: Rpn family recombination-promoting nuclease/putative transposase [Planctomycetaceae bacterium]